MINTVYRLVAPRRFEIAFEDIDIFGENAIVRPTNLSICNADMRYYLGTRDPKVLAEKLPMALIHEGIGEVLVDPSGKFKSGDLVVMVPNCPVEKDDYIAENYLRSSKFCGSSMDGLLQEFVEISSSRLVKLPQDIDRNVAAFTEIVSVSVHAISRFDKIAHQRRDTIAVWGDGTSDTSHRCFSNTLSQSLKSLFSALKEKNLPISHLLTKLTLSMRCRTASPWTMRLSV